MVSLWAWQAHLLLLLQTAASPGIDRVAVALSWLGNYDTYIYIVCVVLIVGGSENATELAVLTLLTLLTLLALLCWPSPTPWLTDWGRNRIQACG